MSLPASIIVTVHTEVPPVMDTSTGKNTCLFLTTRATAPASNGNGDERVLAFSDARTIGTELGPDSEAYRAGLAFFSQNPHPPQLFVGFRESGEAIEAALTDAIGKFQFYGIAIDRTMSDADALKVAAWGETEIALFGRQSSDANILLPGNTSNFATSLQQYDRSFAFARETDLNDYPEVAVLSRMLAIDPRLPNSAITIGTQPLTGITPSRFTYQQFLAITTKNANVYQVIGPNPVVFLGTMANGLFIEDQFIVDWLQSYITQRAINGIERAKRVPQTNAGMNYLVGWLDIGLVQIVDSGFLAPGTWDAATIPGVVTQGEPLNKGYKIVVADISTLTPEQRAAGFGSNIAIVLKGSGAIHQLNIYMPFNP
jgi:hypothetical protein